MAAFDLARLKFGHLIVQSTDARLNPPESYYFIQDFLIISCGILYALCYFSYTTRTYADKKIAGVIEYTAIIQAYEIFYAFEVTSTPFEFWSFMIWFIMDVTFAAITIMSTIQFSKRPHTIFRMILLFFSALFFLNYLTLIFPDEREQITAYWVGILLQFPIGWASVYLIIRDQDTKGHSLEIWITRFLGCWTAYAVFLWRYLNNPEAWWYVGTGWSKWIIILTMVPETVYPFIYVWIYLKNEKVKTKTS